MSRFGSLFRFEPLAWALALAGIALLVRLPLLVGRSDAPPNSDAEFYLTLSDDLVEGRGFDRGGLFYTPGYPATMAALRQLPGRTEDVLVVSQHLLGVAVVAVIVLASWRYFGRVAAIAAGALAAVTPLMAVSEHQPLPDFLFGALVFAGGAAARGGLDPGALAAARPARSVRRLLRPRDLGQAGWAVPAAGAAAGVAAHDPQHARDPARLGGRVAGDAPGGLALALPEPRPLREPDHEQPGRRNLVQPRVRGRPAAVPAGVPIRGPAGTRPGPGRGRRGALPLALQGRACG